MRRRVFRPVAHRDCAIFRPSDGQKVSCCPPGPRERKRDSFESTTALSAHSLRQITFDGSRSVACAGVLVRSDEKSCKCRRLEVRCCWSCWREEEREVGGGCRTCEQTVPLLTLVMHMEAFSAIRFMSWFSCPAVTFTCGRPCTPLCILELCLGQELVRTERSISRWYRPYAGENDVALESKADM